MERQIRERIAYHRDEFANECRTWLNSPEVKELVTEQKDTSAQIKRLLLDASNTHPLSVKQLKYSFQISVLQFVHGQYDSAIKKKLAPLTQSHKYHGDSLLRETGEIDTNRAREIQSARNQANPFTPFYNEYADLVAHIDTAILWADYTLSHISNAQGAQVAQYLTRNSEKNLGKSINAASQATDIYSQMQIAEALANTKTCVGIVHDKAVRLQSTVLPQNWHGLSSSDIAWTLAGKVTFPSGTLGGLAKLLNLASITELSSNLYNLKHGLTLLRDEAMRPINAYHQFEDNREQLVTNILAADRDKLLNHKAFMGLSINGILLKVAETALGPEDDDLKFNFKKAAIGFAMGLTVSFATCGYALYKVNDNQLPFFKEPAVSQPKAQP